MIRFRVRVDEIERLRERAGVQGVLEVVDANDLPGAAPAIAVKCINATSQPSATWAARNEPLERRSTIHPSVTLPPR